MDDDEDEEVENVHDAIPSHLMGMGGAEGAEEDDDNEGEIDLDNIDYDQLDPQILEIAEQMGVPPKEVLKQLIQINNNGGSGDDDDMEGDDDENDEDIYGHELQHQQQVIDDKSREEQLRREKELFKQQMMGGMGS